MTDDEAAQIQARWAWISRDLLPDASQAKADIRALLDERVALLAVIEEAIIAFEHEVSVADPTIAKLYAALGRQRDG